MARELGGFEIGDLLYEIDGFTVHAARSLADGQPVLAKVAATDFPPLADVQALEHELRTLQRFGSDELSVLRPLHRLDENRNSYVIYQDFSGLPVDLEPDHLLTAGAFLDFAREMMRAIESCHRLGLVHGALTPRCVLWNRALQSVLLTHFVRATREGAALPAAGPETLSVFSAPEQTGRLQVGVDRRTDLYSAGAIIYFLLTGQPPFPVTRERADLVHDLIAKQPVAIESLRPEIPRALADLIARLLAKSPTDRPASALEVMRALDAMAPSARSAAETVVSPQALASPAMQGRQTELRELCELVGDAAVGSMQIALVEGAPGSGKSRLFEDLRESLRLGSSLVAIGKFDQYRQPRPYSALIDALNGLLDGFLSGTAAGLARWRQRLAGIDESLRAVLGEQLPSLGFITGAQSPPPRLGPAETQNRFHFALRALIDTLCDRDHPLVLFIDDFQWADEATAALLPEVFLRANRPYLSVILAFRPKEAAQSTAVSALLEAQRSQPAPGTRCFRLEALSDDDVAALCADVAHPCRNPAALAAFVGRSCRGNPLFALELLKRLWRTGGLVWTGGEREGAWEYRPKADAAPPDTESVLDLIVDRIDALPVSARQALIAAACIGHSFRLRDLAVGTGLAFSDLRTAVRAAHSEGLIVVNGADRQAWLDAGETPDLDAGEAAAQAINFTFVHDRVQQAAHSLSDQATRNRLHLVLGRSLLDRAHADREVRFAAVEHLTAVVDQLDDQERVRLAEHGFLAGCMAKQSVAYQKAADLFADALKVLATIKDGNLRRLSFQCRLHVAEALYLTSRFEQAESSFELALAEAASTAEEIEVHRTRLVLYLHVQRYAEAIALGLRALSLLGVKLPARPSAGRLLISLSSLLARARKVKPDGLARKAACATPEELLVLDLMILLWTPSFWINQRLNALVVLKLMRMTLRLGNTPQAPMAYVCFGILKYLLLKAPREGMAFGRLALETLGDKPDPFVASRVRFLAHTFFGPLQHDNRTNVQLYEDALGKCLASGEHVFAGHTIDGITTSLPIQGFRLRELAQRLDGCASVAEQISSPSSRELIQVIRAWVTSLAKGPGPAAAQPDPCELKFDSSVGIDRLLGMATAYLWNDDRDVLRLSRLLQSNPVSQSNPLHASFHALFTLLSLCRLRRSPGRVRKLIARIERFESIYPPNFRSMLLLARAEEALSREAYGDALEIYHQAIGEASTRGHDLIHAIASERLAACYDRANDRQSCQEYLAVASYSYARLGANAKLENLASKYPGSELKTLTSNSPPPRSVDLGVEAVMRAAYAIAEETRSDELARNLLQVITTTAGGERGFLVKHDEESCVLLAGWDSGSRLRDCDVENIPLAENLSEPVVRYVSRTRTALHLRDPARDPRFRTDSYLQQKRPQSLLCLPLMYRGDLSAVLYLENSLCAEVFTTEQCQLATLLGHQAAITMAIADYHGLQLEALQAKINPHFLHNTLSVIAELIVTDPQKAETAVVTLSKLYRYVLTSSADQIVTLAQELSVTRDYLTLEQYRFQDRLTVDMKVEGPVDRVHVPALILQPLVENSVRHGVARKLGPGKVSVHVAVEPAACLIRVADDGPGWKSPKSPSGFGLRSVEERLALLYSSGYEFKIESNAGVVITIKIPRDGMRRPRRPERSAHDTALDHGVPSFLERHREEGQR
jgi:predicted ATPase/two-component sensor histidine kinase